MYGLKLWQEWLSGGYYGNSGEMMMVTSNLLQQRWFIILSNIHFRVLAPSLKFFYSCVISSSILQAHISRSKLQPLHLRQLPFFVSHLTVCGLSMCYFARVIRTQVIWEKRYLPWNYREEAHHYRTQSCNLWALPWPTPQCWVLILHFLKPCVCFLCSTYCNFSCITFEIIFWWLFH